jgi:hypothetical protein
MTMNKDAFKKVIGGRQISFNVELAKKYGVTAALLLSQACYFDTNLSENLKKLLTFENGEKHLCWFHKDKDWREETALTEGQLRTAKKVLKDAKVLHSIRCGMPYETFYYVDFIELLDQLNQPLQTSEINVSGQEDSAPLDELNSRVIFIDNKNKDNKRKDNKNVFSYENTNLAFSEKPALAVSLSNSNAGNKPKAVKTKTEKPAKEKSYSINGIDEFSAEDDEFYNVCKFVASFCLCFRTSQQRNQMPHMAKQRTKAHASALISSGKAAVFLV